MDRPLSLIQKGFVEYVESIRPDRNPHTVVELVRVKSAMESEGFWEEQDEWRISTWFTTRIDTEEVGEKKWFKVMVECDGQQFSCRCPTIEKAFLHSKFYRHIIFSQFYSVGPPWA
jgi:hypothetical protein